MLPQEFRKHLRKQSTPAEKVLWAQFRDRRFVGLKFRRQHSIGHFTVDFFCDEIKLVVGVDGKVPMNVGQHNYDVDRDRFIKSQGFYVYRVENDAVLNFLENVLEDLRRMIDGLRPEHH